METNFAEIKAQTQQIIDLIAAKNHADANFKLTEVSELLDELFDQTADDADLVEISRYQVLLNQLHQKINNSTK